MKQSPLTINLEEIIPSPAKVRKLEQYLNLVEEKITDGADVIVTGRQPVWLYLAIGHHLHGIVSRLTYQSPVTGQILIFDHRPD